MPLAGLLGQVERQREHVEVVGQRPARHDGRERLADRAHDAGHRRDQLGGGRVGAGRVRQQPGHVGGPAGGEPLGDAELAPGLVLEGVGEALHLVHHVHRGLVGHGPGCGARLQVEQLQHEPDASHAVGDGVVDLQDHRAAAAVEAVHQGALPQRPGPVEALHGDGLGHLQQVAHGAVARHPGEAEVVAEVEVGVDLPPRRCQRQRVGPHPLAQPGHHPTDPVEGAPQVLASHGALQHHHGGDGGAQHGVLLDGPHEGVGIAHAVLEAHLVRRRRPPLASGPGRWRPSWRQDRRSARPRSGGPSGPVPVRRAPGPTGSGAQHL